MSLSEHDRMAALRAKAMEMRTIRTQEQAEGAVKAMTPRELEQARQIYVGGIPNKIGWWFDRENWCWRWGSDPLPAYVQERNAKGQGANGPNRTWKKIYRPDAEPPSKWG